MLELLTVLPMKNVISFVCTQVPFLEDVQLSLPSLQPAIFSLQISVMFSSGAGPDINHQNSRDSKLAVWKSEHILMKHEDNTLLELRTYKMIIRLMSLTGCNVEVVSILTRQLRSRTD